MTETSIHIAEFEGYKEEEPFPHYKEYEKEDIESSFVLAPEHVWHSPAKWESRI